MSQSAPNELARIDAEIAVCLYRPGGPWPLWLLAMGLADWTAERELVMAERRDGS